MTRAESYAEELRDYQVRAKEVAALLRPGWELYDFSGESMCLITLLMLIDVRGDARLLMTK